jgi:hypothetical protein
MAPTSSTSVMPYRMAAAVTNSAERRLPRSLPSDSKNRLANAPAAPRYTRGSYTSASHSAEKPATANSFRPSIGTTNEASPWRSARMKNTCPATTLTPIAASVPGI